MRWNLAGDETVIRRWTVVELQLKFYRSLNNEDSGWLVVPCDFLVVR